MFKEAWKMSENKWAYLRADYSVLELDGYFRLLQLYVEPTDQTL
jgi:hypothetical protein